MKFKKQSIVVNDRTFFYWQKNVEKKEVLIFLHGFPGNHAGLIELADCLGNQYRIIIPDLPACGASELLEGKHILENYAKWLDNFMAQLQIEKAVIVGHSFGARVALSFSVNYPQRIKGLILMTPVLKVDGLIAYFIALHANIAKLLPEYMAKHWLSNGFYHRVSHMIIFKSAGAKKRQEIMRSDSKESKNLNHRVTMEIFDEFYHSNLIEVSHQNKVESLIIAGDSDEIVSLGSIKKLSDSLVNSKVKIMENSGHLVPLESPKLVAEVIVSWLKA